MESKGQAHWTRIVCVTLFGVAFLLAGGQSTNAQEPDKQNSEVQQLREKLQKLEQTVQELKTQLANLEQPRLAPATAKTVQPETAKTVQPETPKTVQPEIASAPRATAGPPPAKSQEPKKGESTFQVYGFAMLDMGYQFNQNDPDWFDVIRPTKLPSFKDEFAPDGKVYFGVRQSRLGVKTTTATSFGELKTQFEFELFGTGVDAGQTTFRLRHAYGELGHFGAGQTWSPFMDIDVFPNSIEYWGPNGMAFFRNVQVRWMPIQGDTRLTFAVERPGSTQDAGRLQDRIEVNGIISRFPYPDISGEFRLGGHWGYV